MFPAVFTFGNTKRADARFGCAQAHDKVNRGRVVGKPHVRGGRLRICCTWVRVINGQKLFPALAHLPLSGEKIFGRSFIGYRRIGSQITSRINCLRAAFIGAADEAAAFVRARLTRVRDDLIQMGLGNEPQKTCEGSGECGSRQPPSEPNVYSFARPVPRAPPGAKP